MTKELRLVRVGIRPELEDTTSGTTFPGAVPVTVDVWQVPPGWAKDDLLLALEEVALAMIETLAQRRKPRHWADLFSEPLRGEFLRRMTEKGARWLRLDADAAILDEDL